MRGAITVVTVGLLGVGIAGGGCANKTPSPPQDVPVPLGPGEGGVRSEDRGKPMPGPEDDDEYSRAEMPPPPFNDVPLVSQETPEQQVYVDAYNAVGRPRIVVFVNRTLQGELIPVNDSDPALSVERRRTSRGDVTVESRNSQYRDDLRSRDDRDTTERFESRGPGEFRDRVDVYLRPGQYDEVLARGVDYEAIENVLTDWLAAGGQTEIVSPVAVRREMSEEQIKRLQGGDGRAMSELVQTLDADVLVHVTARPTRQTRRGLEVRLVAEAVNAQGGQSIGRAVVDVPPPLDKPKINKFTRFLGRKLMDGMIGSWESMPRQDAEDRDRNERRPLNNRDAARPTAPSGTIRRAAPPADPPPSTAPGRGEAPLLAPLDETEDKAVPPSTPAAPDGESDATDAEVDVDVDVEGDPGK